METTLLKMTKSHCPKCGPDRNKHASGMTQLALATQVVTSYELDLHQPDNATSRTHS